jgi:hypothetical protein
LPQNEKHRASTPVTVRTELRIRRHLWTHHCHG